MIMRIFVVLCFLISSASLFAQYPTDTLWYNQEGKLKDHFVVSDILFPLGKTELITYDNLYGTLDSAFVSRMYRKLDSLAIALIKDSSIFEIQVHLDCRGSQAMSSSPSQRRAMTLCKYLVEKGVNVQYLVPKGYGDVAPRTLIKEDGKLMLLKCADIMAVKATEPALFEYYHQLNRRVVVKRLARL